MTVILPSRDGGQHSTYRETVKVVLCLDAFSSDESITQMRGGRGGSPRLHLRRSLYGVVWTIPTLRNTTNWLVMQLYQVDRLVFDMCECIDILSSAFFDSYKRLQSNCLKKILIANIQTFEDVVRSFCSLRDDGVYHRITVWDLTVDS